MSRSIGRRLAYIGAIWIGLLGAAELGLRAYSAWPRHGGGATAGTPVLMCVGDSVTEGIGPNVTSWPTQLGEHSRGVRVENLGSAGSTSDYIARNVYPALSALPKGTGVDALVMIGHNEFIDWPWEVGVFHSKGDGGVPTAEPGSKGLLLVRVAGWALSSVTHPVPTATIDPQRRARYQQNIKALASIVHARGGEVWMLTYVVPGAPPPTVSEGDARVLSFTRSAQLGINTEIRSTASTLGLPMIDVAYLAGNPEEWDHTWFIDNIHLTTGGYGQVADVVRTALTRAGRIPE